MSFDLYFCRRKAERINFDEVKAWAQRIDSFTPNKAQLWYSNLKTGVYFSFDFEAAPPKSPGDGPDVPPGYFDSGLSFNMNYVRPSYFAFEAMPIVADLTSKFGLSVVNPQDSSNGSESGLDGNSEALTRSWVRSNQRAILVTMEEPKASRPLSMSATASHYLWRYATAKEDLDKTCGEGVFVPTLVPVHKKGETNVGRAFAYTSGLPTIVPECEWIFIVRRKKGFLRGKEEREVAALGGETFREALSGYIKPFHWQDPSVQLIPTELARKAGKVINDFERTLPRSDFEVVRTDGFVDIDLPSEPA